MSAVEVIQASKEVVLGYTDDRGNPLSLAFKRGETKQVPADLFARLLSKKDSTGRGVVSGLVDSGALVPVSGPLGLKLLNGEARAELAPLPPIQRAAEVLAETGSQTEALAAVAEDIDRDRPQGVPSGRRGRNS